MIAPAVEARFWSKVRREEACWIWTARVDRCGYGVFSVSRQTIVRAHRMSWAFAHGEVPPSGCLLHRCGNLRCVNAAHLYIGSAHERTRRPRSERDPSRRAGSVGRTRHWTHRAPGKVRRGARSNLSKLCAEQVREIRALHAGNVSIDELARRFQVVRDSIVNIVRFRTWRDLGSAAADPA